MLTKTGGENNINFSRLLAHPLLLKLLLLLVCPNVKHKRTVRTPSVRTGTKDPRHTCVVNFTGQ